MFALLILVARNRLDDTLSRTAVAFINLCHVLNYLLMLGLGVDTYVATTVSTLEVFPSSCF